MAQTPGYVLYQEAPSRPLTARNLADYALCPQKFLLSFFLSREQTRGFLGGAAALQQAARLALIGCYREGGPGIVPPERLLELFEQHWEGELCADSLEEEQLHRQGQEMLRRYHAAHATESARTVALDLRMEVDLGGHRFVAVADRVYQEQGHPLTLLRYKTTRRAPGPGMLAKDLSAALLLLVGEEHFGESAQAAVYALRPQRLVIARLGEAERQAWREQVVQQAGIIRRAREYPTRVGRHCGICRAKRICPAWHEQSPPEDGIWPLSCSAGEEPGTT